MHQHDPSRPESPRGISQKGSAGLMASGISTTPDRPARSDDDGVLWDVLLFFFVRIRSDGCLQPTEIPSSAEASGLQACLSLDPSDPAKLENLQINLLRGLVSAPLSPSHRCGLPRTGRPGTHPCSRVAAPKPPAPWIRVAAAARGHSPRRRRPARRARIHAADLPTPPGSRDPPVDTVDPTPRIGSTLSTVPNCSGRHRRPATVLGSTPPTRTCSRLAAVALSTALGSTPSVLPHPRVDAVDPPVPTGGSQSGVRVGVNRETRFEKQVTFENAKEAGV